MVLSLTPKTAHQSQVHSTTSEWRKSRKGFRTCSLTLKQIATKSCCRWTSSWHLSTTKWRIGTTPTRNALFSCKNASTRTCSMLKLTAKNETMKRVLSLVSYPLLRRRSRRNLPMRGSRIWTWKRDWANWSMTGSANCATSSQMSPSKGTILSITLRDVLKMTSLNSTMRSKWRLCRESRETCRCRPK